MTSFVVAFVVALVATPLVATAVRRFGLIDQPNHRSSHTSPTPRGGGIAVALATVIALAAHGDWPEQIVGLTVGAVVLGVVGLIDDRRSLEPLPRLAVHFVTPLLVALYIIDPTGPARAVPAVAAAVLMACYVNAFNFMDGINGISALQATVAAVYLGAVADAVGASELATCGWVIAGAALGFLPFNGWRAMVFLGDVGSLFIGFWLAGLGLLVMDAGASSAVVVVPFLLYALDTSSTLMRRVWRGERLTEAHREHAYQRLVQAGWHHTIVGLLTAAITAACSLAMYQAVDARTSTQVAVLAGCVALLVGYLALPYWVERRRVTEAVPA